MNTQEAVFALLGVMAFGAGVLVVTARNVIHSALWLVVCFGALAGCYVLLTAEFVAWVQVLIYIGAVVVLMLFGAMLTRAPIGRIQPLDSANRPVAAVVALAAAGTLVGLLVTAFRDARIRLPVHQPGDSQAIGASVFRYWVLPFEVASVLLLAALVGAIVLSRRDVSTPPNASR